ncbi:hypothetical protein [uncultured Fibrella sp.]|uniref:hypothetical protein n=1 Tax=uncultured Fibrella sp. TaxID=1284596 RepID=UPI0035C9C7F9
MENVFETTALAPINDLQALFPHLFIDVPDEDTGEVYTEPRIVYVEGQPLVYRFDGKTGRFNFNGKEDLGKEFAFQPICWRQFTGNLFDRKDSTRWVEFFFIDDNQCVSTVLFNNSSELNFTKALKDLVYSRKKLEEMRITVTTEKLNYDVTLPDGQPQKGVYYAAVFNFTEGNREVRLLGRDVCRAYTIYTDMTARATKTNTRISVGYAKGFVSTSPEQTTELLETSSLQEPDYHYEGVDLNRFDIVS